MTMVIPSHNPGNAEKRHHREPPVRKLARRIGTLQGMHQSSVRQAHPFLGARQIRTNANGAHRPRRLGRRKDGRGEAGEGIPTAFLGRFEPPHA